jgi:hypothetical protein
MQAAIPAIEITNDTDAHRGRRPNRKDTPLIADFPHVGSSFS